MIEKAAPTPLLRSMNSRQWRSGVRIFLVYDAKTGADITRSVLAQIAFRG
jgi:polyhydroxyalkanoate synthesis regulator protein